jgi:uncharacterized damage-inducible protein DinB
MPLSRSLIAELKHEAASTRRMLEAVPFTSYDWRPHEKSMTLGRLSSHIAEIPVWINRALDGNQFDFAGFVPAKPTLADNTALLAYFDQFLNNAVTALEAASDEALNENFVIRRGEQVLYQFPRKVMIRNFTMNHLLHHRGQLSVYLRLLNKPVPGMYGPSADGI